MKTINRREFLRLGGLALAALALPTIPAQTVANDYEDFAAPPQAWGRIATWWKQAIHTSPSHTSDVVAWKRRDAVIPLTAAMGGSAPWSTNSLWYQTEGGFIHSGYIQPCGNQPQTGVGDTVSEPGFWAQVCVPITTVHWSPESARSIAKLYYGTVYRVIGAEQGAEGAWWYRLKEGFSAWSPGSYVPAATLRRIPPTALSSLMPDAADKWLQINRTTQTLTCFVGETPVFQVPVATGLPGTPTPRGEFRVLYKRHTRRMIGGAGAGRYDLPGIAFPTYFTWSGVAIHGTYWHNDFGRPHSHGCVNVSNAAAQWIFRWVSPVADYATYTQDADPLESGTRVVVI